MAKTNLTSMSVDALLKLRDDIADVLSRKAHELKQQLSRLAGDTATGRKPRIQNRTQKRSKTGKTVASKKVASKKVAAKYRGPDGATWSGRGLKPRWLSAELTAGKNIEEFLIGDGPAKTSRRKK
jgi:DNA-binding protein H-NS